MMDPTTTLLEVEVLTPRGSVGTFGAYALTAPGELGEFQVLHGHIPLLTGLHTGVLVLEGPDERHVWAVGEGYVRVSRSGRIDVLVDRALAAAEIEVDSAEDDLRAATAELAGWNQPQDATWRSIQTRLEWADARLRVSRM